MSFLRDWQMPTVYLPDGVTAWVLHWPDLPGDPQVDHHTADTPFLRDWWLVCWPSRIADDVIHMAIVGRQLPTAVIDAIKKMVFRFCLGPTEAHGYGGLEVLSDNAPAVLNVLQNILGRWHHEITDDDWQRVSQKAGEHWSNYRKI